MAVSPYLVPWRARKAELDEIEQAERERIARREADKAEIRQQEEDRKRFLRESEALDRRQSQLQAQVNANSGRSR